MEFFSTSNLETEFRIADSFVVPVTPLSVTAPAFVEHLTEAFIAMKYSRLNVQQDTLVLFYMQPPNAVLTLPVGLGPVRGQHHPSRICDLSTAHRCKTHTHMSEGGRAQ